MDHTSRSPSSFDSCDDLPDLISPEDIDKHPFTLNSCTWDSEVATNSIATDQVTYARTRTASSPTLLLSEPEIRAHMLKKYSYFERTGEWKKSLRQSLLVYSKIKSKL